MDAEEIRRCLWSNDVEDDLEDSTPSTDNEDD
jgi:hypothetical protein